MPSSRPSSSSGRRPPNATHDSTGINEGGITTSKRSSSSHDIMMSKGVATGSIGSGSNSSGHDKRRISDNGSNDGTPAATTSGHVAHKVQVGPKRKSKVGIAGLADHHLHHHTHGISSRKKNASSTGLSRKDKSRSQLALANVVNDIAQMTSGAGHNEEQHQQQQRPSSRDGVKGKGKRTKSTLGQYQRHQTEEEYEVEVDEDKDEEIHPSGAVATTTAKAGNTEDDNEAGWVSTNSSAAVTPETGTSPISPESYKALEFGKKNRRRNQPSNNNNQQQQQQSSQINSKSQVPPLEFPTYQQRLQRSTTEEDVLAGATPRQRESALSLGAPGKMSTGETASSSNLASHFGTTAAGGKAPSASTPGIGANACSSSSSAQIQDASLVETPLAERADPYQDVRGDITSDNVKSDSDGVGRKEVSSASRQGQPPGNLPQQAGPSSAAAAAAARPSTMRKTSTSTIRSLASMGGARAPMSTSFRRQTMTPLQPQLDTSVEGMGELKHSGLTPKQNDTPFPTNSYAYEQQQQQGSTSSGAKASHRRQVSTQSTASNKAGTLSPKEAEELAKRLRTVSGSDLPSNTETSFGAGAPSARSALRRSASTAQGTTLASLQKYGIASPKSEFSPGYNSGGAGNGGALSTLKRASGYFGSIGRLASIGSTLGLTSLDKDVTTPSPTSPVTRRALSSGGSGTGNVPNQAPSPVQRLQNAYGAVRSSAVGRSSPQIRQPLISKFIDPSENYHPFPKASTVSSSSPSATQGRNPSLPRGTSSRARQKLLTQRDYPEELALQAASGPPTGSSGTSDEDPTASQVNLRKNLSSKNLSGTSTPMQPGVQRWLVSINKEADRIDREHETFFRFHDTLQASFARILERKAAEEQEEARMIKEGSPIAGQHQQGKSGVQASQQPSRPSNRRTKTTA